MCTIHNDSNSNANNNNLSKEVGGKDSESRSLGQSRDFAHFSLSQQSSEWVSIRVDDDDDDLREKEILFLHYHCHHQRRHSPAST